jgi:phosphoribosyl-ATP pyrophosphohydrolase
MNDINKLRNLPDDIIRNVLEFIPREKLIFVNHIYYNLYHHMLRNNISNYESYVRDMIRRDNSFVFEKITRENMDAWIGCRNYRYKDMIFNNYIYFILYFCIENKSERCREILIEELEKRNLCRNLHKKNVIKYIKWKT